MVEFSVTTKAGAMLHVNSCARSMSTSRANIIAPVRRQPAYPEAL
jgi:hypothetical protein